jgi:hypothetical protein
MPLAFVVLLLSVASILPVTAFAEDSPAAVVADESALDRRVCRRVQVTGSRVKERICRTQRDWDQITEESNETVDRAQERGNVASQEG